MLNNVVDFLFEVGILAKTPRSGFHFLGSGEQSVAEHLNRTAYAGYALAHLAGDADVGKVVQMCLFHDLAEARVSDLNYVHQKYTERHEERAISDLAATLPFGKDIAALLDEYEKRESREAQLAKDADQIELILSLKEQIDIGNARARAWLPSAIKRLKTEEAKKLADVIVTTDSDRWWIGDPEDDWWVHKKKKE